MINQKQESPIFLEPVMKQMVWGGNRLREVFGYTIPGEDTGECWAVSAHPNGDCVIKNGVYKGKKLSEVWEQNRNLFGGVQGDRFPLFEYLKCLILEKEHQDISEFVKQNRWRRS